MNYDGKQALVLGLGESGLAMALWLARCGAAVRVADTRNAPDRLQALREQAPDAAFVGGAFTESLLDGVDFVAVSPGLAPARELAPLEAPAAARTTAPRAQSHLAIERPVSPRPSTSALFPLRSRVRAFHLSFSVDRPNSTSMMVMIQKRTTTCVSFQPCSSKWW